MLVIANGAFKSGSTWQFRILKELSQFPPIPDVYQAEWANPSLDINVIEKFLAEVDIANENYISKNHLDSIKLRDLVLQNENVRVFNIERDIRDVLVSAYYHKMRQGMVKMSFKDYMDDTGFTIARGVLTYHQKWNIKNSERYFSGTYEALHHDFNTEVRRMANFLNIPVTEEQLKLINEKTSIQKLRIVYEENNKTANEQFFRKGEIGDWMNYFDESLLERLKGVQAEFDNNANFLGRIKSLVKHWFQK